MLIGGLQKLSLIDYPGKLACVIFSRGCNFRCSYCHNPELVKPECYCQPVSEDYLWSFLRNRQFMLDGVVVSGGEPTIHLDLPEFLEQIKTLHFAVKLDTNGSYPSRLAKIIALGLVDYIAMDVKTSLDRYEELTHTRFEVGVIEQSIELIKNSGIPHEFRTTVVKSLCGDRELENIQTLVHGCQRYRVQRARIDDQVLDPELTVDRQFSTAEISALRERWEIKSASPTALQT